MKNKKISFFVTLCLALGLNAQDVFKVLASKGTSTVKASSGTEWKKALIGMKIQQSDAIKLNASDYLGLIHIASGKTLELKAAGTYSVKDLASKASGATTSYSQKYAEYVMASMSGASGGSNNSVGGVVYRATDGNGLDIEMDYPSSSSKGIATASNIVDLTWKKKSNPGVSVYKVIVTDVFDVELLTLETKDTTCMIDLSKLKFSDDEKQIIVKVIAKNPSERKSPNDKLVRIVLNESKDFAKRHNDFLSEVKDETALNYLIKAKFYQDNDMFIDAVASYDKAIALEPKIDEFKRLKMEYLENMGVLASKK